MIQIAIGTHFWLRTLLHSAAILAGAVSCSAASGADYFSITSNGKARAEIFVEAAQPEPIAFAAQELQRYIKQMSDAELAIVHAPSEKPAIVLVSRPSQREKPQDPREEDRYRLNVDARKLRIEGASPRAVLFGVYDLLERLGCGWCVPGDDSVPKNTTLSIPFLEIDKRPAFQYRMMLDFPLLSVAQTIAISDWIAKNRMNWVHECPNAHGEPKAWYERRERVGAELEGRGVEFIISGRHITTEVGGNHLGAHQN